MMHTISFCPVRMDAPAEASLRDDTLSVNGRVWNLSDPGDCSWIVGKPARSATGWSLTIILPHGAHAPAETRFPRPVTLRDDGPIPLPPFDETVEEESPSSAGQGMIPIAGASGVKSAGDRTIGQGPAEGAVPVAVPGSCPTK